MYKRERIKASLLALGFVVSVAALAAKGPVPIRYHGMWAAGGCQTPQLHIFMEATGMQLYGPDKRTPAGDWRVGTAKPIANGTSFQITETNSGKKFSIELTKLEKDWLKLEDSEGAVVQLESCPANTQ